MVGLKSLAALVVLPLALGRVTNMTAPDMAFPGQNITAVLHTEGYIQNWDGFGVIWGLKGSNIPCPDCVGTRISYNDLLCVLGFHRSDGGRNAD